MWIIRIQGKIKLSKTKMMILDDFNFDLFCKRLKDMNDDKRILIEKQNESIENLKKLYSKAEVIIKNKY